MVVEFCKECSNFDDRANMGKVDLCSINHRPIATCPQFTPRIDTMNLECSEDRFCLNCSSYTNIAEIYVCSKDNRPGLACGAYRRRNLEFVIEI